MTGATGWFLERFLREHLASGDVAFCKVYLGALVDRFEVDDREIHILGRKDILEQCAISGTTPRGVIGRSARGWLASHTQTAN